MSNKGNKYKVGVLVIFSILALFISLLSLGITKYFRKTYPFMTIVRSSVQGLQKGAKVRYKGVTVGSVKDIQLNTIGTNNDIFIIMEFDPTVFLKSSRLINGDKMLSNDTFISVLNKSISKGLRCQLNYEGITGQQYVEISYFDPKLYPVKDEEDLKLFPNHPPFLPSVESASVSNILIETQTAVQKIAKIDFEKISKEMEQLLSSMTELIDNKDIHDSIRDIKEISNNLKQLTLRLNNALDEDRINEITQKINNAADNFNRVLVSSNALIDYIERNPQSLLKGKAEKPVVDHE
jgi:ABC-type transporter Mla subunit MlaD